MVRLAISATSDRADRCIAAVLTQRPLQCTPSRTAASAPLHPSTLPHYLRLKPLSRPHDQHLLANRMKRSTCAAPSTNREQRGPTPVIHTLFDKSFFQALSLDESVWFDRFYKPVVCPIFYVETLADLALKALKNRTPEREVQIIADKFPDHNGAPCTDHRTMIVGDLLGNAVPLDGRIPISGGRAVRSAGTTGVVFDEAPEATAFNRWRNTEFSEIERTYAADLRQSLAELDLSKVAETMQALGVNRETVPSLQAAKIAAEGLVIGHDRRAERLYLALQVLRIPVEAGRQIVRRWEAMSRPPLPEFAPYASHVLVVELFFHIATGAQLFPNRYRQSNRTDIAYLFYLPFCHAFVSSDKLHRDSAPLFLRSDQKFLWGPEVKADLKAMNAHYLELPETVRDTGILAFAPHPPVDRDYLTAQLYDWYDPGWRDQKPIPGLPPEAQRNIVDRMNAMIKSTDVLPADTRLDDDNIRALSIPHLVRRKKGSWYQVPKGLSVQPKEEN